MTEKRILLVEDDNLLRTGLRSMIEMRGGYVVADDVSTGSEAIQSFMRRGADILILDLRLPDMSGTEVLRQIRGKDDRVIIIALTACDDSELICDTLEHGANGYVLKGANPEELFLAIYYAGKGDLFISPQLARSIASDYLLVNKNRKSLPAFHMLTAREREIVHLVSTGLKSKEIAAQFSISVKTVSKHRSNILGKLGLKSCSELRRSVEYIE